MINIYSRSTCKAKLKFFTLVFCILGSRENTTRLGYAYAKYLKYFSVRVKCAYRLNGCQQK